MGLAAGTEWLATLAVLARIGAALAVTPPFAHLAVPRRVRALLAIGLAVGLAPGLDLRAAASINTTGALLSTIVGEVLIGLAMGLAISMVFAGAAWAGELVSNQLGLNLSEAYDPAAGGGGGAEGSPLARAYWMLAVVVFLAANGHHALLRGLRGSFDAIPLASAANGEAIVAMLVALLQSATMLALQLAAPAFVATLAADIVLGLAGRTIPQLGGLAVGLPLRTMTGLIVVAAGIAMTVAVLQGATLNWPQLVQSLTSGMGK
jgi:flagellar biosynthetic protein FliR